MSLNSNKSTKAYNRGAHKHQLNLDIDECQSWYPFGWDSVAIYEVDWGDDEYRSETYRSVRQMITWKLLHLLFKLKINSTEQYYYELWW